MRWLTGYLASMANALANCLFAKARACLAVSLRPGGGMTFFFGAFNVLVLSIMTSIRQLEANGKLECDLPILTLSRRSGILAANTFDPALL